MSRPFRERGIYGSGNECRLAITEKILVAKRRVRVTSPFREEWRGKKILNSQGTST